MDKEIFEKNFGDSIPDEINNQVGSRNYSATIKNISTFIRLKKRIIDTH